MRECGICRHPYEADWGSHTRGAKHQDWMRATGRMMAWQLKNLDRIFDARLSDQKQRETGQLPLLDL